MIILSIVALPDAWARAGGGGSQVAFDDFALGDGSYDWPPSLAVLAGRTAGGVA